MFKKLNAWLKPGGLLIYNTPEVCSMCFEHSKCSHMLSPLAFYAVHLLAQDCLVIRCEHLCQELQFAINAQTKLLSRLRTALCSH